jgi:ribosomal protein S18 acetylase RimI-like enzyme
MGGLAVAEIIVRPLRAGDAEALARLWLALVEHHRSLSNDLPGPAFGGARRYARQVMQRLDDPQTCTLIAEWDGEPIGFVLGMIVDLVPDVFDQEPAGFLADIYVDPLHRRCGVGRMLVSALTDWFHARGVRYFDWQVAAQNRVGLAFWRSFGGREVMVRMRADVAAPNAAKEKKDDGSALPDG